MLTSEADAKGKWCPFSRKLVTLNHLTADMPMAISSAGRANDDRPITACLGSMCAAWRWQGWKVKGFDTIAPNPDEANREGPRLGYCGLAGEPSPYGVA
jgi:hypothetical protein